MQVSYYHNRGRKWWRGLDSNQRTQRGQIYSLLPLTTRPPLHRGRNQTRIKKGFVLICQVCDDIFMSKPPKRPPSASRSGKPGKSGKPGGGRRGDNAPQRSPDGPPSRSSKRGSFRKAEQDNRRKPGDFGTRPADKRGETRKDTRDYNDRPSQKIPPRPRATSEKLTKIKADLFGFHAVREAWQNPKRYVHGLFLTETAMKEFESSLKTEAKRPEPVIVSKEELDRAFPPGTVHQGIALSCQPLAEVGLIDIIIKGTQDGKTRSLIVILDQVTDPHNIGAIMRSACAFGADGIVMQSKHAPDMTGILAKTASGAADHIPVAYETNLSRAIETLKEHHYVVVGMDEHAAKSFGDLPKYERAVIVLGNEGSGMRRLIRDHCDVLVTLPTKPPIASLNVSNAAAVAIFALTP